MGHDLGMGESVIAGSCLCGVASAARAELQAELAALIHFQADAGDRPALTWRWCLAADRGAPCAPWTDQADSSDAGVGYLHALRRLPHGTLATAIIACRRRRARVPEHRLHRREVHARVEEVARKRAPAVMRREGCRSEEHTSELQSLRHLVCRL